MSITFVDKSEWVKQTQNPDAILIGAFLPSLSQATTEAACNECGRPVYVGTVSSHENSTAKVVCILCGLKLFSSADQATLRKLLSRNQ
jgi:hypothetical protein